MGAGAEKERGRDKELAEELYRTLVRFFGLHHQKFLRAFREGESPGARLKKNQQKLIALLYCGGPATPSELSRKLDLEKGGVTTLLDSLEKAGLVARREAPADRRKQIVVLTPQGKMHMEKVMAEHQEILSNILKKLDRSEVEELIGHLRKAIEIIERL
ncbi:MarR family winged helix-turn-helix transcriptional regulator [Thermanaeromonas sp. C210]|uniref:MarR family winged helix-turn-helix transcriptional regulator n=1 Tax=Thermanaeromonas sp. C210 TaxID=2731925 RepID=UPI00155CFBC7|nr:MarR family winged helix-turn-helix transcriptional regulator [Thermanaeromonas sp. C210]GFN23738.1 MarR family transcriptional regulator [Thermanaeromonas sp. C210]